MNPANIEAAVQRLESLSDRETREAALGLAQSIMDLHRSALTRMLELLSDEQGGQALIDRLAADPQISGVLLLHDVHPVGFEARVREALADPLFHARGANAELVSIEDGVVRVRIQGGQALQSAVEAAVWDAAPDAADVVVEGARGEKHANGFVPLERLITS
jgi:hypothetical protein